MRDFIESGYRFIFGTEWEIMKYDSHRFYTSLSGHSMSGVDFAGILDRDKVVLLEIKNYKQYDHQLPEKTLQQFKSEIEEKALDSLQLINVIYKFLNRKWQYKVFYGIVRKYSILNKEWYFWSELYRIGVEERKLHFVLLLDAYFNTDQIKRELNKSIGGEFTDVEVISLRDKTAIKELKIDISKVFKAH